MPHEITITLSEEVYRGLQAVAGSRSIGEFIQDLTRPVVTEFCLDAEYRDMALDAEREREAVEWADGVIRDSISPGNDAPR